MDARLLLKLLGGVPVDDLEAAEAYSATLEEVIDENSSKSYELSERLDVLRETIGIAAMQRRMLTLEESEAMTTATFPEGLAAFLDQFAQEQADDLENTFGVDAECTEDNCLENTWPGL